MTIRRFGWSDVSQQEAQAHADSRVQDALQRLQSGEKVPRRELKRAYNGAVGVPIREEIVARRGETIITRNSYGALCLNTPNVFIADIDFVHDSPELNAVLVIVSWIVLWCVLGWWSGSWHVLVAAGAVALLSALPLARLLHRATNRRLAGSEATATKRIERFLAGRPEWSVRLYRTPAGLRLIAMHRTFDPSEPRVAESLKALSADPVYTQMCLRQHCFRARVSPKPWRIGIFEHLKPRPGIWPVKPERMPDRLNWIREYEKAAQGYASCRFVAALGSGTVDPAAAEVQRWHDELCRAESSLPIA